MVTRAGYAQITFILSLTGRGDKEVGGLGMVRLGRGGGGGGGGGQGGVDDRLRISEDAVQVIRATKALGVYLIDVFGAGRTRREPSAGGGCLQTADGCAVAGSPGEDALDFFAGQLGRRYLLR